MGYYPIPPPQKKRTNYAKVIALVGIALAAIGLVVILVVGLSKRSANITAVGASAPTVSAPWFGIRIAVASPSAVARSEGYRVNAG
jgi:hypothetical protein